MLSFRAGLAFTLICLIFALPAQASYDPALEKPLAAQWSDELEALGRRALTEDWDTAGGADGARLLYAWYVLRVDEDYAPLVLAKYGQGSAEAEKLARTLELANATVAESYWKGLAELTTGAIGLGTELVVWLGETKNGPDEISAETEKLIGALLSEQQQQARALRRIRPAAGCSELAAWLGEVLGSGAPIGDAATEELHSLVFHVPVNFNDGRPVPAEMSERLEKMVCEEAGGFSVSAVDGAWEDGGTVYREPMRRFLVGLPEDKIGPFVDKIVALLKGDYAQLAVWVEVDGEPEIL